MLPFWVENVIDEAHGGFVGRIRQNGERVPGAPKGSVLNARILWTFAAAHRVLDHDRFRELAERAQVYLMEQFWDSDHGGVFWTLDYAGSPLATRKQIYAQAFALYALAEYHRATGDPAGLEQSIRIFDLIETRARDRDHGGYLEAFGRSWDPIEDVRLSERDLNVPKSMNTHLHLLEAYTNLCRVWPDARLRSRLAAMVEIFLDKIVRPDTDHLHTFFELDWTPVTDVMSFGHDVEASWLLLEAADVVGDAVSRSRVREAAIRLARATLGEGIGADGGVVNERRSDGSFDEDRTWWAQFEAIVGFVSAHQETQTSGFLEAAVRTWEFAQRSLRDDGGGEWYFRVDEEGRPYPDDDQVGMWKGPYHGVRACLEVMARADRMAQVQGDGGAAGA